MAAKSSSTKLDQWLKERQEGKVVGYRMSDIRYQKTKALLKRGFCFINFALVQFCGKF
ncbi:MAG: hypothetical protein CEO19_128 [Parcubacteria group bacterium Gr01-1014_73]|nr:MAG: hypothetical protein CEO19_128 [Parcubacteria group bacterium Gr01-1014_73]